MANIQSANQSPRVTMSLLGQVNDPTPGALVSTASVSGSIVQPYGGQLGGKLTLNNTDAVRLSVSTNLLYGGIYQYVQFYTSSSGSNARGQIVFWYDVTTYTVTPDAAAANIGLRAGITLGGTFPAGTGPTTVTVTKGYYAFIQVAGVAQVKFGTVTKSTPVVSNLVIVGQGPANTADVLADATAVTNLILSSTLGNAYGSAPATGVVSPVLLMIPQVF